MGPELYRKHCCDWRPWVAVCQSAVTRRLQRMRVAISTKGDDVQQMPMVCHGVAAQQSEVMLFAVRIVRVGVGLI